MKERRPGILFIANSLAQGGAEQHVITLLNHLDTRRFRLHLAYLKRQEALLGRLDVGRLDVVECVDVASRIDPRAIGRLRRLVRSHDIDLIVTTNQFSTLYGTLARGTRARAPRIAAVFHTTHLRSTKQRLSMQIFRRVFARCDRLVYVCESQRAFWHAKGLRAKSEAVIHNGIDAAHFADRSSSGEKSALRSRLGFGGEDYVIGLCGGLRSEKAHADLVHAVAALRSRGLPARALLIGDGPERQRIEALAAALGIAEHVRITGFQRDVRPFVSICDVMTLVSHSETFSLAALESMACAKPLVMSDVGGAREQVDHGVHGLIFAVGDVAMLTAHLAALVSADARRSMGLAAAERVRRVFTLERMASSFEQTFDELTGGRASSAPASLRIRRPSSP